MEYLPTPAHLAYCYVQSKLDCHSVNFRKLKIIWTQPTFPNLPSGRGFKHLKSIVKLKNPIKKNSKAVLKSEKDMWVQDLSFIKRYMSWRMFRFRSAKTLHIHFDCLTMKESCHDNKQLSISTSVYLVTVSQSQPAGMCACKCRIGQHGAIQICNWMFISAHVPSFPVHNVQSAPHFADNYIAYALCS